ncbi:hypothetical protein SISSUDRAFT_539707 [Sistotremastrum suecicum HHB10207 ss-3]|uniref:AB hydrolase-1 domain-containing protein n=1 Tax=Sistotremastrum suecicum HHB10207 ss-3 TaxID=1314776 RepID=A0A166F108_9AGAM|nr:hypothetical protein SISSUDRAFT_539707 [Sistotremastrum suecicum HHB10207 ss-3]
MVLSSEYHIVDPRPEYPFQLTVKCYKPSVPSIDGYTLVFAHGTAYHKEHWEPEIERLFELSRNSDYPIREAWSIDCPNHGDAGVLNAKVLQSGYSEMFDWQEYSRSINIFLNQFGDGYFADHRLVGIGHSSGATALILAGTYLPTIRFDSVVLCEALMAAGTLKRNDIWPSKQAAFNDLSKKKIFASWDRRILGIYCEYGLTELPTANYPDKKDGVTWKCYKYQERATYLDITAKVRAFNYLPHLCKKSRVHIIWGDICDLVPRENHDAIVDQCEGRAVSVQRVKGAAHLITQTHPIELADRIFQALAKDATTRAGGTYISRL